MKTKLLSILTLLLCVCSGAWATETSVVFSSSNNNDAGNAFGIVAKNSSITAGGGLLKIFSSNNTNWAFSNNNKKGYRFDRNTFVFYFSGETDLTILYSQNNTTAGYLVLKKFTSTKTLDELATSDITGLGSAIAYTSVEPIASEGAWATVPSSVTVAENMLSWTAVTGGLNVTWDGLEAGYYQLSRSASSESYMYGFIADVTASTAYNITWNNGGHGTAPTSPTSASTFTLPTMDADGGYTNTGWTANQDVTVNKATVTAGTVIPVSTSVTLSANTTFTGVWKAASTFALTSASEVEVAIAGNSTITSENAAGTVTYSSADESIATVSDAGVITGVAGGKTTITVTDPGSSSVAGGSATVTVLVPYVASAADSYVFTIDQYAFSNSDDTKYYFKNGFTMDVSSSAACQYAGIESNTGIKYSHARQYTINVPDGVTVKYAVIKARNNYASGNGEANWGTVFGTSYSSETLPWSTEDPVEKDFVIASPSAGGTLVFQPGGNQWQAIITLCTIDYHAKYTVSYAAGDGTGTMDGTEVRGGSTITLPASTFTAPSEKGFAGWLCDIDDIVYAAGASYTMTDANTTFTAQYEGVEGKMIIKAAPTSTSAATVTGAIGGTADVNLQSSGGSWKFGGDTHHIGVTLAGDWTFKTGDLLNVHITNVADISDTQIILYNKDRSISYETGVVGVLGDNMIALPAAFNGQNELYIYRLNASNKWNAFIDYIEVYRPDDNKVVTLNDKGFATYSYDKAFVVYGATAYKMALDIDGGTLTGTAVEKVPAGAGVLLKGEAGASVNILETSGATELTGNSLHGTTQADGTLATMGSNDYYVLSGDTFKKFTGDAFTANKAYFEVDGTTVQGRVFSMIFDDGTTTGVNEELSMKNDDFASAPVYNLAGQRVAQPTKGLYIVNGKKVVVK